MTVYKSFDLSDEFYFNNYLIQKKIQFKRFCAFIVVYNFIV